MASSWRNEYQPEVVAALRKQGHNVYDFRNPPGGTGFAWAKISPTWQDWTAEEYREALGSDIADAGFQSDFRGMNASDTCVLVLPCGRSAHLEAGYMAGQGKRVLILTRDGEEPELMALLCDEIFVSLEELLAHTLPQEGEKPAPTKGIRVSVVDLETGAGESQVIDNNYVLITAGNRYLEHENVYSNGTAVLTVKVER